MRRIFFIFQGCYLLFYISKINTETREVKTVGGTGSMSADKEGGLLWIEQVSNSLKSKLEKNVMLVKFWKDAC